MANAKWSGIEQWKYGLTADWYVSAKYGSDIDVDGVGLYDRDTNPDGWGGPKRPFDGINTLNTHVVNNRVVVFDSGQYVGSFLLTQFIVGDGNVTFMDTDFSDNGGKLYNCTSVMGVHATLHYFYDSQLVFCTITRKSESINSNFIECDFGTDIRTGFGTKNCAFIRCKGNLSITRNKFNYNNIVTDSPDLILNAESVRPVGVISDYSIIIGTVKSNITVNGKAPDSALTVEDFKADGQYFRKSYSEVDLFGNAEGSGASIAQLNTIFNNFFYPYSDDWQYVDLSLRPDVDDRVRYGGLNGHFIGALPVGYSFDMSTLWNTYRDSGNTSNVELNMNDRLVLTNSANPGVFTSTEITLPEVVNETDVATFFKNNVYDSNGVAVQRLDYTEDPVIDNTLEQRTVYSFRMKTAPDDVAALSAFKEYELDRAPTVDENGNSNIDLAFDVNTQQRQDIKRFIIEITLRSE